MHGTHGRWPSAAPADRSSGEGPRRPPSGPGRSDVSRAWSPPSVCARRSVTVRLRAVLHVIGHHPPHLLERPTRPGFDRAQRHPPEMSDFSLTESGVIRQLDQSPLPGIERRESGLHQQAVIGVRWRRLPIQQFIHRTMAAQKINGAMPRNLSHPGAGGSSPSLKSPGVPPYLDKHHLQHIRDVGRRNASRPHHGGEARRPARVQLRHAVRFPGDGGQQRLVVPSMGHGFTITLLHRFAPTPALDSNRRGRRGGDAATSSGTGSKPGVDGMIIQTGVAGVNAFPGGRGPRRPDPRQKPAEPAKPIRPPPRIAEW